MFLLRIGDVLIDSLLIHKEGLELFITSTFTGIDKVSNSFLLFIVILATVERHKFIDCQESATNPNHDSLSLNLHEDFLSGKAVDSWRLSLEVHFASQAQWGLIDVVGQILVNLVFLNRFVNEEFVLDGALNVLHLLL